MKEAPFPLTIYGFGIDPGQKNLGFAVVKETETPFKFEIDTCSTQDPSLMKPEAFANGLIHKVKHFYGVQRVHALTMERFVPYNNVWSDIAENVNHLIGMLSLAWYNEKGAGADLLRAIEWKTNLVKKLARYTGFDNPSKKGLLDKQFSIAAAKHISINPEKIKTDHEADAICLAAYPLIIRQTLQVPTASS